MIIPVEPTVSIVIPARNEASNLAAVLPELPRCHEVILVDGYSVDDTVVVAQRTLPGIKVITQDRIGKGNALACGFRAATGDIIVMFDADGSADPVEIPRFVAALQAGADFAKGSRFRVTENARGGSEDITTLRRIGNDVLNGVANLLLRTEFTDLCYGYNAFWRDILPILDLPGPSDRSAHSGEMRWGDGFEIETLINCRIALAQLTITEVPSVERRRMFGETHLRTFADGLRVLRTLVTEYRRPVASVSRPDRDTSQASAPGPRTAQQQTARVNRRSWRRAFASSGNRLA